MPTEGPDTRGDVRRNHRRSILPPQPQIGNKGEAALGIQGVNLSLNGSEKQTIISLVTRDFRWNEWNVAHIAKHGIEPGEAEYVIRNARPPYPGNAREDTYEVFGQSQWGAYLHVVYVDRWSEEAI